MESTLKWLTPNSIVTNWDLNPRARDEEHILEIARHMNDNGYDDDFPVIVYNLEDGPEHQSSSFAATGYHRLAAAALKHSDFPNLPLKKVYVELRNGTMNDVVMTMMTDNWQWSPSTNRKVGKMPSADELRAMRYRLMLLPDNFRKADRLLAKEWNCGRTAIYNIREEIVDRLNRGTKLTIPYFTEIDRDEILRIAEVGMYIGSDGKLHPRTKTDSLQASFPGMSDSELLHKEWDRVEVIIKQAVNTLGFRNLQQTYILRRLGAPRKNRSWGAKEYKKGVRDATAFLKVISEPELDSDMANMVEELELYNEAIDVYKPLRKNLSRPYLTPDAENAAKEFDEIGTADWEEKERSDRLDQLRSLIKRFKGIYAAENRERGVHEQEERKKRVALELERTGEATEKARQVMWDTYEKSDLPNHTTKLVFARSACTAMGYIISENVKSPDNVILGKEGALVKDLQLDEIIRWRSTFEGIAAAINNKVEWVGRFIPRPEECLRSLKLSLSTTGTLEQVDRKDACKMFNIKQDQFDALKQQTIEEGCADLRKQNREHLQNANNIYTNRGNELEVVGWEGIWKAALLLPQFSGLSEETFTGAHDKESFNDYPVLLKESQALARFEADMRFWNNRRWIKDLIPPPVSENGDMKYTKINRISILAEQVDGNEEEIHVGNSDEVDLPLNRVPNELIEGFLNLVQSVEK